MGRERRIDIGELNKRVKILGYIDTKDELGQEKQVLEVVREVWASLYPTRGAEYYEAQKIRSKTTYKCYMRYTQLTTDNLLECKGKRYTIESVLPVDGEKKLLEIYCTEHGNKEVIECPS